MQVRIAALADYTNVTANGKLNILGIFSQIYSVAVPAMHPAMQLVAQFAFEPSDAGEKHLRILLMDADGNIMLSLEGGMAIKHPGGPDPIVVNQVLALQNVKFPHFGSYEFVLEVDGEPLDIKVPVDVIQYSPSSGNQV